MRLHLTMKLSPNVCTLKDWNSPQSLRLRYQRHQTLPLRPNTNLSPLLTRHTPRYLPLSRCSPWKYAMKCNACVPKSFQVQNKSICKGRNSTTYEGAYTKTMHGEAHKNMSIQIMSKHLSFVKEKHHHKGLSIL